MYKLLVICGPTATGKTDTALSLARKFDGELISADSRQVYKGMDIGTGKDIPKNFRYQISDIKSINKAIGYFTNNETRIWGLDLVKPDHRFSLGEYVTSAKKIIHDISLRNKLPIIVGGTGLYIKALTEPLTLATIPQNKKLRMSLDTMSLDELQIELQQVNLERWNMMNQSDRKNPRRLIRAIEIGMKFEKISNPNFHPKDNKNILTIELRAPLEELKKRVESRVEKRISQGIEDEVKRLVEDGYDWNMTSMSGLGYKEWKPFFEISTIKYQISKRNKEKLVRDIIEKWKLHEYQYAKRQITWFKKQKIDHWFYVTEGDYKKRVVEKVARWYNT